MNHIGNLERVVVLATESSGRRGNKFPGSYIIWAIKVGEGLDKLRSHVLNLVSGAIETILLARRDSVFFFTVS